MSLNKQAFNVLNQFANAVNEGVKQLRTGLMALGINTVEDAEPIVTAWAAERHSVPMIEGQRKAKGRMVLDKDAAGYEAAKKARQRVMEALIGDKTSNKGEGEHAETEEVEIPAELLAAAQRLAKLAQQYEGAKKLASRALATAFAK
jgi:hypothetical protein